MIFSKNNLVKGYKILFANAEIFFEYTYIWLPFIACSLSLMVVLYLISEKGIMNRYIIFSSKFILITSFTGTALKTIRLINNIR